MVRVRVTVSLRVYGRFYDFFSTIGSGISEPQVAENRYLPLTGGIALTTVYALTCYTVIMLCGDAVILEPKWSNTKFVYLLRLQRYRSCYTALVNGEVLYHVGASR